MLTQDQIKANIDAMEAQGAPRDVIQSYLNELPKQESKPKKTLIQKVGNTLDAIFGGKTLGEGVGALATRNKAAQGNLGIVNSEFDKLSPEAKTRLQAKGFPISAEESQQQTAQSVQGPNAGQLVGDVGRVALNFAPIGRVSKGLTLGGEAIGLGKLAKPLANIGTGAGVGYGADVTTKAAEGVENPFTPGAGTGIGAGISALPYVGKGLAKIGAEVLGVSTGTGAGTLKQFTSSIAKGGEEAQIARDALRGNINSQDIVDEARTAFGQIIKNRSDEYASQLSKLKTKTNTIDHAPIIEKFNKQLEDFGVFFNQDGTPNFSRSPGLGRYEKDLAGLSKTLSEWGTKAGDSTIAGIDKLKQVIDDFRIGSADSKKFDTFVTSLRSEAKNIIRKDLIKSKDLTTLNTYEKMLGDYEKSTKEIKEIQKALSLGDKASMDTAFRKLSTVLRTNNEIRKQAIDQLNEITGGKLLSKIAGQQLSEALPRGLTRVLGGVGAGAGLLSGVGIISMLKLAIFTSPRLVGEILNVLGIVGNKANIVKNALIKGGISPGDALLDKAKNQRVKPIMETTANPKKIQPSKPADTKKPINPTKNNNSNIPKDIPQTEKKASVKNKGNTNIKTLLGGAALTGVGALSQIPSKTTYKREPEEDQKKTLNNLGDVLMKLESSGGTDTRNADKGELKWLTGLTKTAIAELKRTGIKDSVKINDKEDVIDASIKYFKLMLKRHPNLSPGEVYADYYWTQSKSPEQRQKKIDEFNELIN